MRVSAASPLAVASLVWQPRPEVFVLTVICKATYALRQGAAELLETPDTPLPADLYWQEGTLGSVRRPTDFVPFKRRVDVLLGGHAYAPRRQAVRSLVARFAVGAVDKAIAVHGDRYWMPDGSVSEPIPFKKMPLRWERAAGGPGTWNPAGMPSGMTTDPGSPWPRPNLEPVGFTQQSQPQDIPPIGFGPLAPHWPTRRRQHGPGWSHEGWQERPLPPDVDAACFNAAPPDQQIEQLPAQAQILLENLHPEIPRLITVVEDVRPRAIVSRGGAAPQEIGLRCDTVFVDADRGTCTLTWRAGVPLGHPREEGDVVVTPAPGGATAQAPPGATREEPATAEPRAPASARHTLPFALGPSAAAPTPEVRAKEPAPSVVGRRKHVTAEFRAAPTCLPLPFVAPALPFVPASSAASGGPGARAPAPDGEDESTRTLAPARARPASAPLPSRAAPPSAPEREDESTRTLPHARTPPTSSPLPFRAAPPSAPDEDDLETTQTHTPALAHPPSAPLPFRAAPPSTPDEDDLETTQTHTPALAHPPSAPLPFRAAPPVPAPLFAPGPRPAATLPVPTPAAAPARIAAPLVATPSAAPPLVATPASASPLVTTRPSPTPPARRPPGAAALGTSPLGASPLGATPPAATPPAATPLVAAPHADRAAAPPRRARARATVTPLSLERYARIKVELWGTHAVLHEVLERHNIDEVAWRIHDRRQADALAAEAREGRCDLALALVAAFEAAQAPAGGAPAAGAAGATPHAAPP